MQLQLYEMDHGNCPYLPERRWVTHSFKLDSIPGPVYETMLADGWRRSSTTIYQNHCPGCRCCTPLRVGVHDFRPSASQRRVLRRNAEVTVETGVAEIDEESFSLYRRYVLARHPDPSQTDAEDVSPAQFEAFLVRSSAETRIMKYRVDKRLVGVGWIDVLPDGLSSVYFAFEPDESRRSLGTYSIMKEIDLCARLGKRWLYLGFYVPGSQKMAYKGAFQPREFAVDGKWTAEEESIPC